MALTLLQLLLLVVVLSSPASACAPGQATKWDSSIVSGILKSPSWPWHCEALYIWSEKDRWADLYEHFDLTRQSLRQWNCFFKVPELEVEPGQMICVNATSMFVRSNSRRRAEATTTSTNMKTSSTLQTKALDFTTYAIFLSVLGPSTRDEEEESTRREQTTYSSFTINAIGAKGGYKPVTTTEPSMRYWTTYTTTSTAAVRAPATESDDGIYNARREKAQPEARSDSSDGNDAYKLRSLLSENQDLQDTEPSILSAADSCGPHGRDCRVAKLDCDITMAQHPTCIDGECRCAAVTCAGNNMCGWLHQCRADDEQASCIPEPGLYPDDKGICECTGRGMGCLYAEDRHGYCGRTVPCTEKGFSVHPEFPRCVSSDGWLTYPRGRCDCLPVYCETTGNATAADRDREGEKIPTTCEELVSCGEGVKPRCVARDENDSSGGDDGNEGNGYCTCSS